MPSDKIKVFKLQRLKMSKPTPYLIGEETDIPQKSMKGTFHSKKQRSQGQEPFRQSSFTLTCCVSSTNLPWPTLPN